jgi:hypothetical protein
LCGAETVNPRYTVRNRNHGADVTGFRRTFEVSDALFNEFADLRSFD